MKPFSSSFSSIWPVLAFSSFAITLSACGGGTPDQTDSSSSIPSSSSALSSASSSQAGSTVLIEENQSGFCSTNVIIESEHPGATGVGYANTDNVLGGSLAWSVEANTAGSTQLRWRFANGSSASRSAGIYVNGVKTGQMEFAPGTAWDDWQTQTATINLEEGTHLIELKSEVADGLANIDSLEVQGDVEAGDCSAVSVYQNQCSGGVAGGRKMECLDRGVIAVTRDNRAFISWRYLGTDTANTAFNLYRRINGNTTQICSRSSSEPTWCWDNSPITDAMYYVKPVINGVEGLASSEGKLSFVDYIYIPLEPASDGAFVHLGWTGDLDGDGEMEVIVDRISAEAPLVDAYKIDGSFLWRLNTGPLGVNQNGIEGGATTISNGHWDGLTVFDFDSNGRAEIAIKTANGFVFGDGTRLNHSNNEDQFVSIVDGLSGREIARAPLPSDYISDGPLQCHFGAGYLDGINPSVVTKCKNRVGNGGFNSVTTTYRFDGTNLTQQWKYRRGNGPGPDFHQIRIIDVDGNGTDEILDGGYVLNGDGTVRYNLGDQGVVHGDRFHITDMDPTRPGLEGWAIQQDNANGLETYYYDAATGDILRRYSNPNGVGGDMGRGVVADVFADSPGMEYWSFNGMYASSTNNLLVPEINRNVPWPNFQIQWDGDTGSELLDNNRVGDWNTDAQSRNTYFWRESFGGLVQARGALPFFGDIYGDWREEVLIENAEYSELRLYTTTHETEERIYTLLHNPAYRNSLTVQGYKQPHYTDYFFGFNMEMPPQPKIVPVARP